MFSKLGTLSSKLGTMLSKFGTLPCQLGTLLSKFGTKSFSLGQKEYYKKNHSFGEWFLTIG